MQFYILKIFLEYANSCTYATFVPVVLCMSILANDDFFFDIRKNNMITSRTQQGVLLDCLFKVIIDIRFDSNTSISVNSITQQQFHGKSPFLFDDHIVSLKETYQVNCQLTFYPSENTVGCPCLSSNSSMCLQS